MRNKYKVIALMARPVVIDGILEYASVRARNRWFFSHVSISPFSQGGESFPADIKFDGIISENFATSDISGGIPLVSVSGAYRLPKVVTVTHDNVKIGCLAAEHLLSQGVENFYFFRTNCEFEFNMSRFVGFRDRIRKAGFECAHVYSDSNGNEVELIVSVKDLLHMVPFLRGIRLPAGIYVENDSSAHVVLDACRIAGIHVPDHACVIGTDNDSMFTKLSFPTLSSIDINDKEVGFKAAEILDLMMAGQKVPMLSLIEPAGVVQRESSDRLDVTAPRLAAALRYIRAHACEGIGVSDVFRRIHASRSALEKDFRAHWGKGIYETIVETRLAVAKRLLSDTDDTLETVAYKSGFPSAQRLQFAIRKESGLTASSFRNKERRKK